MRLPAFTVSGLLATLAVVQASPLVPRENGGSCTALLVDALYGRGLNKSADFWKAGLASSSELANLINGPYLLTVLVPENNAFNYGNPHVDTNVLLYSVIYGTPENFFEIPSDKSISRRGGNPTHSTASTGYKSRSNRRRKRWLDLLPGYQVQVIDQTFTSSTSPRVITISNTVGDSKVIDRFTVCGIPRDILVIDKVPELPGPVSEALCKPLIKTTPQGLTKFESLLQAAGLLGPVDNASNVTVFAPTNEAFKEAGDLSDYNLPSLLKNHFYSDPRILYSPRIESTPKATAASGNQLCFRQENGVQYVSCGKDEAIILRRDVITENGVLHVIDRPLKCW